MDFQLAANLGEPPLTIFSTIMTREPFGRGQMFAWSVDNVQVSECYIPQTPAYTVLDQAAVALLNSNIRCCGNATRCGKIPRHFESVNFVSGDEENCSRIGLLALALFSIIEMLITHNPNDKEIGDSLMHQIRTKIALLSERFVHKLDYSGFPTGRTPTRYGQLCIVPSLVAHGGEVDFAKNDLRQLVSRENALGFLQVATRRLLRHALEEPSLVDALKPI